MASCEYCWARKDLYAKDGDSHSGYYRAMEAAQIEGWPCTTDTEEGARARAGHFWDETTKRDTRMEVK